MSGELSFSMLDGLELLAQHGAISREAVQERTMKALVRRRLVEMTFPLDKGPCYRITDAGLAAIKADRTPNTARGGYGRP